MNVPFHPLVAHFPLVLACILPVLAFVLAYMIKVEKMTPRGWLLIVGLQLVTTITGYIALETGENEEVTVQKVVEKSFIQQHESQAEVFVGATVVTLALAIGAFFVKKEFQFSLQLLVAAIGILTGYFAFQAGKLGGELVYVHGAGSAYAKPQVQQSPEGILPTPGMNTSESVQPAAEINESLKPDENDYGNGDEVEEADGEDAKQED